MVGDRHWRLRAQPMMRSRPGRALLAGLALLMLATQAQAQALQMGLMQLPQADGGSTTLFYPTQAAETLQQRGPFALSWATDAPPAAGNRRLIVISHGSAGSPWVHTDLARALVQRGFVVALPQHAGDNHMADSTPGPASWAKRPAEVSAAIDAVARHPALGGLLTLDAVGVVGGSAGGHTALSLAGGVWSPARFRDHCLQHIEQDFSSCVGFITLLHGNLLDGPKLWLARRVISWRFNDAAPQRHADHRVQAAVAMVPFAADFDMATLAKPSIPLGLVVADQDVNQGPAFHVQAVLRACLPRCELLAALPDGSHGAMLSPLPPLAPGSVANQLLGDPPGFDRARALPALNARIAAFFLRHLGEVGTPR